jgi:hypothetical protein
MRHGIRQGDSPLRYFVPSESLPGVEYLVEVDAFGGIGCCTCKDFTCRRIANIKDGSAKSNPPAARCKHIEYARDHLLQKLIDALVEQRRSGGVQDDPHDSTRRKKEKASLGAN